MECMTTPLPSTVTLSDPSEVLAAVPHLLGFHPINSVVVVTVHGSRGTARIDVALRTDLPDPGDHHRLAEHLVSGPIRNNDADAVMVFVVGCADADSASTLADDCGDATPSPPETSIVDPDSPPHADVVDALHDVLGSAGVTVLHALWTAEIRAGQPWLCYGDRECRGAVSDPKSSSVAAALAAAGSVTFDSRAELQALVAPESEEALTRRAAKLDVLSEETGRGHDATANGRNDLETVLAAVGRVAEGAALTEDDVIRVLLALSDNRVRDLALSTALGESAAAAEQLWLCLVRKAPPPELADVAALLAVSAYLRGDGALASVVLERIEELRPDHRLGILLRRALDLGVAVTELKAIVQDAAEDARTLIEEEDDW